MYLPVSRLPKWIANFERRHGPTVVAFSEGLRGDATDGSTFAARLPFDRKCSAANSVPEFIEQAAPPADWGILLVRKGGFAVARLDHDRMHQHKIGQRHVQGRTKAGGQSQQRFARRRDNQARQAYAAAADHAHRILEGVPWVVTGGDGDAIEATLADAGLTATVDSRRLNVADPKRAVLDQAVIDALALDLEVHNNDE